MGCTPHTQVWSRINLLLCFSPFLFSLRLGHKMTVLPCLNQVTCERTLEPDSWLPSHPTPGLTLLERPKCHCSHLLGPTSLVSSVPVAFTSTPAQQPLGWPHLGHHSYQDHSSLQLHCVPAPPPTPGRTLTLARPAPNLTRTLFIQQILTGSK